MTKRVVGSATYLARIAPNEASVAALVEPTRMGVRGGNVLGPPGNALKLD
jgi:hypothetical protein